MKSSPLSLPSFALGSLWWILSYAPRHAAGHSDQTGPAAVPGHTAGREPRPGIIGNAQHTHTLDIGVHM